MRDSYSSFQEAGIIEKTIEKFLKIIQHKTEEIEENKKVVKVSLDVDWNFYGDFGNLGIHRSSNS